MVKTELEIISSRICRKVHLWLIH